MRIVGAAAVFCSRGGIGRRVRLRTVWGNPWRFESSREQLWLTSAKLFSRTMRMVKVFPLPFRGGFVREQVFP